MPNDKLLVKPHYRNDQLWDKCPPLIELNKWPLPYLGECDFSKKRRVLIKHMNRWMPLPLDECDPPYQNKYPSHNFKAHVSHGKVDIHYLVSPHTDVKVRLHSPSLTLVYAQPHALHILMGMSYRVKYGKKTPCPCPCWGPKVNVEPYMIVPQPLRMMKYVSTPIQRWISIPVKLKFV